MAASRVFVSHASIDRPFADLVVASLRQSNLAPWIDASEISAGDDVIEHIGHGLETMDVLVFLVSEASLQSEFAGREVRFGLFREMAERRSIVLPFIIDETSRDVLPWMLRIRNVTSVAKDSSGASAVAAAVLEGVRRRSPMSAKADGKFVRDAAIEGLLSGVQAGDWPSAHCVAWQILVKTTVEGDNELFDRFVRYLDCDDDDLRSRACSVIESCAQVLPAQLIGRPLIALMATHRDFSVRLTAAAICMDWAQWASDRIPVDLLIPLSVADEDWYVQAPANAALKAMVRHRPALLTLFFGRLRSPDPNTRAHAAYQIHEIAEKEPEVLDAYELKGELDALRRLRDRDASKLLDKAMSKVRAVSEHASRYKYGL